MSVTSLTTATKTALAALLFAVALLVAAPLAVNGGQHTAGTSVTADAAPAATTTTTPVTTKDTTGWQ
ncbi:hypothetical protein [Streptomyces collinus]|uniref:hypothetical protein n=1 Tax=Streptomyces collinus TaxID=42684 RepID=UPI003430C2A7